MNTHSLTREVISPKNGIENNPCADPDNNPTINIETSWQQQYKNSITDVHSLCNAIQLDPKQLLISDKANQQFRIRVPWSYVNRIEKSNPQDPLLLQILPHTYEENAAKDYSLDPVGDLDSVKSPGLLKKYYGRALILATSRCAIHCRYCFRRHFPYSSQNPRHNTWQTVISAIKADTTVNEIILSGGDPLVLNDEELTKLVTQIESIPHISKLRIHTRMPVVIPARICKKFLNWVNNSTLKIIIVFHINHAQEINSELRKYMQPLINSDCVLLNQSVLMRNINDQAETLVALSEALINANILPYYLHMLDKVQGAAHFAVSESKACELMQDISKKLPGYLIPKLVKEEQGAKGKTWLTF